MKTVLFACVHNAGRSQMAAAFFNALADPTKARAISAGTQPGAHVHPEVVEAVGEVGMDLSGATHGALLLSGSPDRTDVRSWGQLSTDSTRGGELAFVDPDGTLHPG